MQSANDNPKRRGIRAALTRTPGKHAPLPRRRHRKSKAMQRLRRLALSAGAFAIVGAIGFGTLSPAEAATTGAGYSGITPDGGYLGNYVVPDGSRAYCMDSSADWPSGATGGAGLAGAGLTTESGDVLNGAVMQRLNYALSKYGQTADATQAAGLGAYVYAYTSTWAHYNGQGYATGVHYIDGNQTVLGAFNSIWNDAETNYNQRQGVPAFTGSMSFSVDNNNYTGSLRVVNLPAGASVDLRLTNGIFTDTGSAARNGVGNGTYAVKGVPADGTPFYKISAVGTVNAPAGWSYDANVTIYYTGGQQRVIKGGTTSAQRATYMLSASDPVDRSTVFAPVLTSSVESRFVDSGEAFTDTITAAVASGSQAWRQTTSGRFIPVVAKGTLYGPFTDRPNVAAQVPAGAPVAGTSTVTLNGPGKYTAPSVLPSKHAPGFYTWVWKIDAADSSAGAQLFLPPDYSWSDQFGLPAETHVRAASLIGQSAVSDATVGIGIASSDTLTLSLAAGPWPTIGGKAIPAHFRNDVYWVAGETAPVPGQKVPAGLAPLKTYDVSVTKPGQYTSTPVLPPSAEAGYLVNVWSIVQDGAGASYFTDWTDGWATPGEVTRIQAAKLSAISKVKDAEVGIGVSASDTLTVSLDDGYWPVSNGQPIAAHFKNDVYWVKGDTEPASGSTIPADAELLHSSDVAVTGPGEYSSDEIMPPASAGYLVNVWTVVHDGPGAKAFKDWTDGWATPGEVTHVQAAKLSGVSKVNAEEVGMGAPVSDKLTISLDEAPWPLTNDQPMAAHFRNDVYWVEGDEAPVPGTTIPTDAKLFHSSDVAVTGPGEYASEEVTAPPTSTGYLVNVWSIIHDGPGAEAFKDWTDGWATPGEITRVSAPTLSTDAISSVALGDDTHDTAIVDGLLPAPYCGTEEPSDGATTCPNTVTFAAYLQQDLGDHPVCEPSNEVFNTGYVPESDQPTTAPDPADAGTPTATPTATATATAPAERDPALFFNKPVQVSETGRFPSADVIFKKVGIYYWVATFRTGDGTVITTGECGDQKEKTVVAEDDVVTKATARVGFGQKGHDTAIVTGVIPKNATIEFAVYKQQGTTPVCTTANEVKVGKPQPLPATGEYASDDYTFTQAGTYFWVEIVRNARGEVTHQGKCGADGETTIVDALASTGSDEAAIVPIGGALGGIILAAGITLFAVTRRTKRTTTK